MQEIGAREREALARDEALRAHAVIYVTAGDLTRAQDQELRWLRGYGKPLLLALNKIDQLGSLQRDELLAALRQRYAGVTDRIVAVQAGGREQFVRRLSDGREEQVARRCIAAARCAARPLQESLGAGIDALEQARAGAVLSRVDEQLGTAERDMMGARVARHRRPAYAPRHRRRDGGGRPGHGPADPGRPRDLGWCATWPRCIRSRSSRSISTPSCARPR